ncbi:MAG: TonB-dependent receptor, partial [Xanthomonadales bacterium]|nr:TonB-dependent receptor [Xanthomonadales bacterium]
TLGLRYSREKKKAESVYNGVPAAYSTTEEALAQTLAETFNEAHCSGAVAVGSLCDNVSWKDSNVEKEWTATIRASYALTEDVNVYLGYSRGYKAGGFNLDQQAIELDYFASYLGAGGGTSFLGARQNADTAAAQAAFAAQAASLGCTVGATNPPANNTPCSFFDDDHAFDPEFVNAWELGLKGQFFDRTLTANMALFY